MLRQKNKNVPKEQQAEYNAYKSPSAMNELCEYVNEWEKRKILWNNSCVNTSALILNSKYNINDATMRRFVKHEINEFAVEVQEYAKKESPIEGYVDNLIRKHKKNLEDFFYERSVPYAFTYDKDIIANYVISVAYSNSAVNKSFAWMAYGDTIIKNLKANSPEHKSTRIYETQKHAPGSYEQLGKYYIMEEGVSIDDISMGTD